MRKNSEIWVPINDISTHNKIECQQIISMEKDKKIERSQKTVSQMLM